MAHNLDETNGVVSFVSARQDAWHMLGEVTPDSMTAQEALEKAHLAGWNLRKAPIMAEVGEVYVEGDMRPHMIEVPDRFAVIRDNPVVRGQIDVLGDVGNAYQIMQNEDLAGLLDALVDESGANYETAGAIDGGRKVFVTMKMPDHIMVGGVDKVDNYIAAMTSHDGSTSTSLFVTPVRIVCQNTLNIAMEENKNQFRVRHTVGADRILAQQARELLGVTFKYLDEFQAQAEQLINTTMTQSQFDAIIHEEFAAYEDSAPSAITRAQSKIDDISRLFADSETHAEVRDTAWAGFNALAEWYDHFSPVRNTLGKDDTARSRKALMDPAFKNKALDLMLTAV